MPGKTQNLCRLCEELNAMAQQLQLALEMSKRNKKINLIIILYSHVILLFQTAAKHAQEGRSSETRARVREMIDAAFAVLAVIKDAPVVGRFFDDAGFQRIYHRKAYQALPRDVSSKIREITGLVLADEAGMVGYFLALRQAVREAPGKKGRFAAVGSTEVVASPSDGDTCSLLAPACECLFLAVRQVVDYFEIKDFENEYYEHWNAYARCVEQK